MGQLRSSVKIGLSGFNYTAVKVKVEFDGGGLGGDSSFHRSDVEVDVVLSFKVLSPVCDG
jgi:hypothetical protein